MAEEMALGRIRVSAFCTQKFARGVFAVIAALLWVGPRTKAWTSKLRPRQPMASREHLERWEHREMLDHTLTSHCTKATATTSVRSYAKSRTYVGIVIPPHNLVTPQLSLHSSYKYTYLRTP